MLLNNLLFIITILFSPFQGSSDSSGKGIREANNASIRWTIEKSSRLSVKGQSNVNTFSCDINGYYVPDTIVGSNNGPADKPVKLTGSMTLEIFRFDCHSRMITNDLRKTLKAEQHPTMTIRFLSLERIPVFLGNTDLLKGWVEIQLAGQCKRFEILYSFVRAAPDTIILNGAKTFAFSDFKLVPPKKLAGIIQIKDEFNVNFRLTLNALN